MESSQPQPRSPGLMKRAASYLARAHTLRNLVPERIRRLGLYFVSWEDYRKAQGLAANPFRDAEEVSTYPAKVDVRLGIVKDFAQYHANYIGACRDMGVPYRLVDISGPDWIDRLEQEPCDAYLVWPEVALTVWKQMFDERLCVMVEDLGKIIYPTYDELWMYESKRRMAYWLRAHGFPHARTWVFYSCDEALEFGRTADLPLVYKPDLGAVAKGIEIFRDRGALQRHIRRVFRKGITLPRGDRRDRQWGVVLLQEYLPDAREWRMMRMGNSYFGYEKIKVGDFHSGSHVWRYDRPSDELLNLLKDLTDRGGFTSMDADIFITRDGRLLVNELQTVFGMGHPYEMCVVDGKPGRMLHDGRTGAWRFEAGSFCDNRFCNQRVATLVEQLGRKLDWPPAASRHGACAGPPAMDGPGD